MLVVVRDVFELSLSTIPTRQARLQQRVDAALHGEQAPQVRLAQQGLPAGADVAQALRQKLFISIGKS